MVPCGLKCCGFSVGAGGGMLQAVLVPPWSGLECQGSLWVLGGECSLVKSTSLHPVMKA